MKGQHNSTCLEDIQPCCTPSRADRSSAACPESCTQASCFEVLSALLFLCVLLTSCVTPAPLGGGQSLLSGGGKQLEGGLSAGQAALVRVGALRATAEGAPNLLRRRALPQAQQLLANDVRRMSRRCLDESCLLTPGHHASRCVTNIALELSSAVR